MNDPTRPRDLPPALLERIDPDRLPPVARMLIRAIGLPATVRLLMARGGAQLHVPLDAARARVLQGVLTEAELRALAGAYGAQRLDLPKIDKLLRQIRDDLIRADRATLSAAEVARRWGLTRRRVISISQAGDPAPATAPAIHDLFDR